MWVDKVFVYGTLRRGGRNHQLLAAARFLGTCRTEQRFTLIDFGPYPGVVARGGTSVAGEVYAVDRATIKLLDELEAFPIEYDRRRLATLYGKAWIYVYRRRDCYRGIVVPGGDWFRRAVFRGGV